MKMRFLNVRTSASRSIWYATCDERVGFCIWIDVFCLLFQIIDSNTSVIHLLEPIAAEIASIRAAEDHDELFGTKIHYTVIDERSLLR